MRKSQKNGQYALRENMGYLLENLPQIVRYKVVRVTGRYIGGDTEIFYRENSKTILQFIHTNILQGEVYVSKSLNQVL